jgi:hypothetical protein
LKWVRVFANREILAELALTDPHRLLANDPDPAFVANPVFLDGCFQAAGVLGTQVHKRASLPAGLGALRVHRAPRASERLWVHVRLGPVVKEGEQDYAEYAVQCFDASGAIVWRIEKYRDYLLHPMTDAQLATVNAAIASTKIDRPIAEAAP